jgi:hypothetical protein
MPLPPEGFDSEAPGSRFTLRPAIAVLGGDGEDDTIRRALSEALGDDGVGTQSRFGGTGDIPGWDRSRCGGIRRGH